MEQVEQTLLVEPNNKTILVFTVVTVVFLLLSFFTSYIGMNLKVIAQTKALNGPDGPVGRAD